MLLNKDGGSSGLAAVRGFRVSLVDELEEHIDSVLEDLVTRQVFTRDDREEVLAPLGPRGRVRKVLDIVECKGEEAAQILLAIRKHCLHHDSEGSVAQLQSAGKKIQQKHKDVMRRRSENMLFYNSRHSEKIPFSEHYVNLLLVSGHQALETKRHEVLTFGQKRLSMQQPKSEAWHRKISPSELFSTAQGARPVKKVLVTGVAGIGKTMLVQKLLYDFGRSRDYQRFDFVIHMSFRDLNLVTNPTNFKELVLRQNRHLSRELDSILANDEKLLIILDGFDEYRDHNCFDVDIFVNEPDEEAQVVEVLGSLLLGELLPEASVMLTSRPTATSYIPVGCVDRFVVIAGFSLAEVQDFFRRYFRDNAFADRIFAAISSNELMLTLCYIPAFCHIVCCIHAGGQDFSGKSPKTMTDIYVQYLVAMLRSHTQGRGESCNRLGLRKGTDQQLTDTVLKLGKIAFKKLMEHQTLFYSSDREMATLEGCSFLSTFLDKTDVQEPGCTDEVFSFAHLTIQEFFAALYCATSEHPSLDDVQIQSKVRGATSGGHLDLFNRFLSGIVSSRNADFLSRQVGLSCRSSKVDAHRHKIVSDLTTSCRSGSHILNSLHCLFEQQDPSLALAVPPMELRVNVSDETLSQMDYNAIKYFLNFTKGRIAELDLTGTRVSCQTLQDIQPILLRCRSIWLGENSLDMDAIQVIGDVLRASETIIYLGLGWTDIGDDELCEICQAVHVKKTLKELWIEGNRVTHKGLLSLNGLIPHPLEKVVVIWNNIQVTDPGSFYPQDNVTVHFTDDCIWENWGEWVLKRCEVSSNESLLKVLHRVCDQSVDCMVSQWAKTFYDKLSQLIKSRIECCSEDNMCKKLNKVYCRLR